MTRSRSKGALIVNADDWGLDRLTTDRTFDCIQKGSVSAVSAMVFMEDSERAAGIARAHAIDAGLHLNLTAPFTAGGCPSGLAEHQRRIAAYLRRYRIGYVVFNPILVRSFEYVVAAQIDEFSRLYGNRPVRIDGHHHAHLCANVLLKRLLPEGTLVRRSFSSHRDERGAYKVYRRIVDGRIARRHHTVDLLYSLAPLEPDSRLQTIVSMSKDHVIEVETHPAQPDEYQFLMQGGIRQSIDGGSAAPSSFVACFGD